MGSNCYKHCVFLVIIPFLRTFLAKQAPVSSDTQHVIAIHLLVSEIVHVLPKVIPCCVTRTTLFLHVDIMRVIGFYHLTKFRCSTPSGF